MPRDVVVLLSGGLDSTVCAHLAMRNGRLHSVVSVYYGQANAQDEQHAAGEWARKHGVAREVVTLTLPGAKAMHTGEGAPGPRVVPGRNLILLAHAIGYAATMGATEVWIGANADDYADYPDCRGDFFGGVGRAAEAYGVAVRAPLATYTKAGVVALAHDLGVDVGATWSCYQTTRTGRPCGTCAACVLRARAIAAADELGRPCPRCRARVGERCHNCAGYGATHPERRA